MEVFGNNLRKQREFRSIPLEEIAETTMISLRFLQAIENGQQQELPHTTFVKGFLRAYAQHIGIDGDEVILGYEQVLLAQQQERETSPEPVSDKKAPVLANCLEWCREFPLHVKVGAGVFLIMLIGSILWFSSDPPKRSKPINRVPAASVATAPKIKTVKKAVTQKVAKKVLPAPVQKAEKPLVEPPKEKVVVSEPSVPVKTSAIVAPMVKTPLSLALIAKEDTWLLIEIDGEKTLDFILRAGESKTLEAKEKILFKTIGNSGAISFSQSGENLPLGGKSGQVLHDIEIKAQTNLKQLVEKLHAKL